jgi:cell division protein FtsI (penicillin-binding protein 3)
VPVTLIDRRIGLLFVGFLGLIAIASLRVVWLGAIQGSSLKSAATSQQVSKVVVPAPRGTITDRNGVDLAVSEPAADIAANPHLIKRPQDLARKLAPLIGTSYANVLNKLTKENTGFVYLKRQLPASKAARIEKLAADGITSIPSSVRVYPQGWLASQMLGNVGIDGKGLAGIEYGQDDVLRGHDGERRLVNDALGQPIKLRDLKTAKPGADVRLTLDAAIQDKVEKVLADVGKTYSPKGATALVMNPQTSEILALGNWPRVDANNIIGSPSYARENRAVGFAYEPGSTFKAITIGGALQDHVITPQSRFNIGESIQVADRTIHNANAGESGNLTAADILRVSSNVGAITIGLKMGKDRFDKWVRRFGFGTPTGVNLPGEEAGIVPRPDQYSGSTMGNAPIGQGLAVTPLQIASAYTTIADGGIMRTPRMVRSINGKPVPAKPGHRVISERTSAELRKMLEGVFAQGGTASEVSIPGYKLAGKTGTANKPDPLTGGYSTTKYVASFVGFAPANHPKLLVAVMVDEPKGAIYGGTVAAPAFQKIAQFALPYLRIAPN